MLGALGLIGGAASVAKAVNDSEIAGRQLKLQRYDRAMEQDCILLRTNTDSDCISAPNKRGQGIAAKKKKR